MQTNIIIPVLFVDIDGTLTETKSGKPFKQSPDDIKPLPGSQKAITHFANRGYKIFGISNQGGCEAINPNTKKPYKTIQDIITEMQNTIALYPEIYSILFCPSMTGYSVYVTTKHYGIPLVMQEHENCRKPEIGMVGKIIDMLTWTDTGVTMNDYSVVDKTQSLIVGDRDEDYQLAKNADLNFMWADEWRFKYGSFA